MNGCRLDLIDLVNNTSSRWMQLLGARCNCLRILHLLFDNLRFYGNLHHYAPKWLWSCVQAKDEGDGMEYTFTIPCGLNHDSTLTVVGKPIENFRIELLKGKYINSVAYRIDVKLKGEGAPYILQTQPAVILDRFEEPYAERCPPSSDKLPNLPDGTPMPIPPIKYGASTKTFTPVSCVIVALRP